MGPSVETQTYRKGHAHRPMESTTAQRPQKFTRFEIAPSTTRFEPVVKEEAGLARNTAELAISCGVAMRPVGLRASASWKRFGMFCSTMFQIPPLKYTVPG